MSSLISVFPDSIAKTIFSLTSTPVKKVEEQTRSKVHDLVVNKNFFYFFGSAAIFIGGLIVAEVITLTSTYALACIISGVGICAIGRCIYTRSMRKMHFIPLGLDNISQNCWINALMQFSMKIPSLQKMYHAKRFMCFSQFPHFSSFIKKYYREQEQSKTLSSQDTQILRSSLAGIFPKEITPISSIPQDPLEALRLVFSRTCISSSRLITKRQYQPVGYLPPIKDRGVNKEGIASSKENCSSLITLPLANVSSMQKAMQTYFDNLHPQGDPKKLKGKNGESYLYPLMREQRRFTNPLSEMYVSLNRFSFVAKASIFRRFQAWFFSNKDKVSVSYFSKKIQKNVTVDQTLTLPGEYFSSATEQKYRVDTFIHHIGSSTDSGHYVAYVRNAEKWYRCDDNTISEVLTSEVSWALNRSYLYHFVRESS